MSILRQSPLFIGNWKMNMLVAEAQAFGEELLGLAYEAQTPLEHVWIAPPATTLPALNAHFGGKLILGSQNTNWQQHGAQTGEVSPSMVLEHGASFSIVGHSERRQYYGETNATTNRRTKAILAAGMKAVVCIGESKADFDRHESLEVVKQQLIGCLEGISADEINDNLLIAYEPVWAIGTGLSASPNFAAKVHHLIREQLADLFDPRRAAGIPALYGGSTTPENIRSLLRLPEVDGVLVGSSSLKAESFFQMIQNGREAWKRSRHG